jgi:DNA-directed RNA polymerase subunit RPC12/RpoP
MLSIARVRLAPRALFRTAKLARSVTCWKCGTEVSPPEVTPEYFCSSNPCGVVQSVKLKDVNAFQLFNLDQKYLIDLGQLESAYKGIQKQLHPDMFATKPEAERDASLQTSTTINQAYQVSLFSRFIVCTGITTLFVPFTSCRYCSHRYVGRNTW